MAIDVSLYLILDLVVLHPMAFVPAVQQSRWRRTVHSKCCAGEQCPSTPAVYRSSTFLQLCDWLQIFLILDAPR